MQIRALHNNCIYSVCIGKPTSIDVPVLYSLEYRPSLVYNRSLLIVDYVYTLFHQILHCTVSVVSSYVI